MLSLILFHFKLGNARKEPEKPPVADFEESAVGYAADVTRHAHLLGRQVTILDGFIRSTFTGGATEEVNSPGC